MLEETRGDDDSLKLLEFTQRLAIFQEEEESLVCAAIFPQQLNHSTFSRAAGG